VRDKLALTSTLHFSSSLRLLTPALHFISSFAHRPAMCVISSFGTESSPRSTGIKVRRLATFLPTSFPLPIHHLPPSINLPPTCHLPPTTNHHHPYNNSLFKHTLKHTMSSALPSRETGQFRSPRNLGPPTDISQHRSPHNYRSAQAHLDHAIHKPEPIFEFPNNPFKGSDSPFPPQAGQSPSPPPTVLPHTD
jgi:hypothetical protein